MKKFLLLFSFVFISSILFESIISNLEARPGGGSSFRSSGSRSSGSSYRSSSSSRSGGGGTWFSSSSTRSGGSSGGSSASSEFTKEGGNAVWCFLLIVVSMIIYFINVPADFFKLNDWSLKSIAWTGSALILGSMAASSLLKSGGFVMMFIIVLFVLPFIFIYYSFKNIFGTKEVIFVAKKGKN